MAMPTATATTLQIPLLLPDHFVKLVKLALDCRYFFERFKKGEFGFIFTICFGNLRKVNAAEDLCLIEHVYTDVE